MINRLTYYLFVFVAVLAAACSHIDEMESPVPDQNLVMRFDMGCDTKVSNDDITSQEFIVYDYIYGASSEGYPDGTCYIDGSKVTLKYRDGSWGFYHNNSDTRVDFLWTKTGTHEFFAYNKVNYYWGMYSGTIYQSNFTFEYNGASSAISTSSVINMLYPTDGDALQGCYQDLIYASASRNVTLPDGFDPVSLEFKHAFASVQVTVRNNSMITKNIEGLSLAYIRCNTGPGNQRPTVNFSGTVSFVPGELGDYPSSGKILAHGDEWEVFDTPVIVLPQTVDLSGHTIQWTENGEFDSIYIADFGTASWDSGKLYHYVITLDPTELILAPTATIEHEDAGGNKFSVVNVNLNAPDGELQRITSLLITVTDPESNVIKTYEAATVDSNEISMECDELLAPGTYTVSVAYDDGLKRQSVSTTAVLKDTAVQPAVGYYVNSDGTFSETFVSGESIAKIFWIGSLSSDTQLVSDYSYLAAEGTDHGLAYEVDETTGNLKELSGTGWGKGTYSAIGSNNAYYDSINNWNGYSCTFIIQQVSTSGFINQNIGEGYQVCPNTSSWFIPSIAEIEAVIQSGVIPSTNLLWTSTMYSGYFGAIECYTYNWSTDTKTRQISTAAYLTNKYFRILAF